MTVSASKVLPWMLVSIDNQDFTERFYESRTEENVKGEVMVVTTGYQRAHEEITVVIERTLFEVKSFSSDSGKEQSSFSMETGPHSAISFAKVGRGAVTKYRCVRNELRMVDKRVAEAVETQVWVLMSDPYIIEGSRHTHKEVV